VLLLCGLPGCGKSSLARMLKERNDRTSLFDRILHIEYDSVARGLQEQQQSTTIANDEREEVFNEESLEAWRSSRKVALEQLNQELESHFNNDKTPPPRLLIIMDDNFHLRSMRKNVHVICQAHANKPLHFCILWLDIPLDTCLKQNRQRSSSGRVPDNVIQNMALEPPDPQKASREQGCILKQSQAVLPPPPPVDPQVLERERQKTRESLLHTYDGYLRAWVGTVAQIRRSDTGKANAARKDILQRLRKCEDTLDASVVMDWFVEQVCVSGWTDKEMTQLKTAMQSVLER